MNRRGALPNNRDTPCYLRLVIRRLIKNQSGGYGTPVVEDFSGTRIGRIAGGRGDVILAVFILVRQIEIRIGRDLNGAE